MIFATYIKPGKADLRFFFWLLFSIHVFSLLVFLAPNRRRQRRTATKTTAAQRKPIFFGWRSLLLLHVCICICERVCESMCVPPKLESPTSQYWQCTNQGPKQRALKRMSKKQTQKILKAAATRVFCSCNTATLGTNTPQCLATGGERQNQKDRAMIAAAPALFLFLVYSKSSENV